MKKEDISDLGFLKLIGKVWWDKEGLKNLLPLSEECILSETRLVLNSFIFWGL